MKFFNLKFFNNLNNTQYFNNTNNTNTNTNNNTSNNINHNTNNITNNNNNNTNNNNNNTNNNNNNFKKEFLIEELHKSIVEVGSNLYIDHFLCQDYFFDIDPFGETTNNAFINMQYKIKMTLYRKYLKEKDYDSILNILDKQKKMEWFIKNHKKIYINIGNTKYFKMFSWILTYVDHHYPFRKKYSKIIIHRQLSIEVNHTIFLQLLWNAGRWAAG